MDEQKSIFFIDLEYDEARVFYSGQKNRVQVTMNVLITTRGPHIELALS